MKKKRYSLIRSFFGGVSLFTFLNQGYPVSIVVVDGVRYPVAIVAVVRSGYPVAIGPGITAPKVMPTEVITKTTRIARPACQGENRVVIIFHYGLPYLRILRKPRISCNLEVLL
jgi:hypothetical protein